MHDNSLPISDRIDRDAAEPADQRAALVIGAERGRCFKARRHRGGGQFAVKSESLAKLFSPHAREILDATLTKMIRYGVSAVVIKVRVIVGQTAGDCVTAEHRGKGNAITAACVPAGTGLRSPTAEDSRPPVAGRD